ncbi:predicted protein [Chaetomium globosum CBS 148.51]|uniref:Uncharacterized protein n=1 Tax=Chaetomium globosum (strain ATCC 6205 / CBS 148.51 / DSM 1962 / NBRC 6347 / NRRL 1970) TaxID=306901 RepID=Q2H5L6_CHAGB|nr:uncharacterized protein CHGG_06049 [Chaetomium globosum CBS 148.51]EAQ89430.1 predicted protein [Chaetomium globosum CBS 148.51]
MAAARGNGRLTKRDQGAGRARKHQNRRATAAVVVTPSRVELSKTDPPRDPSSGRRKRHKVRIRLLMPKPGMVYFCDRYLLMRERRDRAVGVAMRRAFHHLSKALLNERFAQMFEAATEVQQQHFRWWGNLNEQQQAAFNSDILFNSLRQHPSVEPWAQHISKSLLTSLFMILRAARMNWHRAPQYPFDISQHSLLAKVIDAFNATNALSWGRDAPFLRWMIRGDPGLHTKKEIMMGDVSMDVDDEDERGPGATRDMDTSSGNGGYSDGGALANPASAIPAREEMEGVITHADNVFQLTYDQVVESMRLLSIEVDVPSLVEAFARHSFNDDEGEGDSFDDLDTDMVPN